MTMTFPSQTAVRTACGYCGVGCGLTLQIESGPTGRTVVDAVGTPDHPANGGRLCTKGTTTADLLAAPGRMEFASVRRDRSSERTQADLSVALDEAAARFKAVIDEHGPDSVALYVSGQMSLEAQYLATKLAKGYLGTINLESNSRLCMASAGTGYKQSLGSDGPPGSYDDFDHADLFLVIGSNMAETHPILFLRMMERVKAGARLVVVDPRRTATAEKADLFCQIKPGTDLAFLNGILNLLIEADAIDHDFIAEHTSGWDQTAALAGEYGPEIVEEVTGISACDLRQSAAWIGESANWMTCWTMGLNQSTHGTWSTNAICNLHLATGAICRPGSGPFSLTGQPNAMGGREMGYMGPGLPGQRSVVLPADRKFCEQKWGLAPGTIRADVGRGTIDMFEQVAAGKIKAVWIICTNPAHSVANRETVRAALTKAEVVVVQDIFAQNETLEFADIALPAAMWTESESVMVNSERNLTLCQPATTAPGQALPDWELIAQIAGRLGFDEAFNYDSAAQIFDEIRQFANPKTGYDLRGVDYERLRREPVQWPCPPHGAARNPIRYRNDGVSQRRVVRADGQVPKLAFAFDDGRAVFHPRPHLAPAETPDDDFEFVLNTGRLPHQWHTMTKTGKVARLNRLDPGPFVEINPADAARLAIGEGSEVRICSRRGEAVLPAVITDRVLPGNCFAPIHWGEQTSELLAINAVTNDAVDPDSLQPEFKVCAVRLERAPLKLAGAPAELEVSEQETAWLAGYLAAVSANGPRLPAAAPVSGQVRQWFDEVLAALAPSTQPSAGAVSVLWASQTGRVEDHVPELVETLQARGILANAQSLSQVDPADLTGTVLFVTSTTGDGDPPAEAVGFWRELTAKAAPDLAALNYSVLAFGDSAYDDFCGFGRRLDEQLAELGGNRIVDRIDCEPAFDDAANKWISAVGDAIGPTPDQRTGRMRATSAKSAPVTYGRNRPLFAELTRNERLTGEGSTKEVRRFGFELPDGTLTYEAGDALAVVPKMDPAYVDAWLNLTGLDPETTIDAEHDPVRLGDLLTNSHDLAAITPAAARLIAERHRGSYLAGLVAQDDRRQFDSWAWGRQLIDVVREYPVLASVDEWLSVLKPLTPRQYSISSSPHENPNEVQVTVSVVRHRVHGPWRHGVCSSFLADRAEGGAHVFVQAQRHFRPPTDSDRAAIMVGPGTGIAPFRGFIRDRAARGHSGQNWVFFGERNGQTDFYYRDELEDLRSSGVLTRLDTAFSRDQQHRIYVQDRMRENGRELWSWLDDGAHFYVCGDRLRMAKDVEATLLEIAGEHGGLTPVGAKDWLAELTVSGRYSRDVY
ncbi:MAG TPA: bifunctional nitrate reductase/sulfite reductase flavoprotein subunit alpha [Aeromicrobium sp.]|nr:bifunctional nitrate reductase/sulfite reductase flavoprotein subunit alpha [Aeromicrobium sp.]